MVYQFGASSVRRPEPFVWIERGLDEPPAIVGTVSHAEARCPTPCTRVVHVLLAHAGQHRCPVRIDHESDLTEPHRNLPLTQDMHCDPNVPSEDNLSLVGGARDPVDVKGWAVPELLLTTLSHDQRPKAGSTCSEPSVWGRMTAAMPRSAMISKATASW